MEPDADSDRHQSRAGGTRRNPFDRGRGYLWFRRSAAHRGTIWKGPDSRAHDRSGVALEFSRSRQPREPAKSSEADPAGGPMARPGTVLRAGPNPTASGFTARRKARHQNTRTER